jgi:iron(III) transport system ATP-binding protein
VNTGAATTGSGGADAPDGLTVADVAKHYHPATGGIVRAVDGVSLRVPAGEMFGILGASGCGKTTLLRMIAGLEVPDAGDIDVGGTCVFSARRRKNVPPNRRDLSLVFQSYAIWPHLSVLENVAFPLRVRGISGDAVEREARAALASVQLADHAPRRATQLSGGQQQRLALARAFVSRPKLLLLDEPLSNLDAQLREQMRVELKRLQREHGITTVFVTHDQAEGLSLADTVGVMGDGRLMQVGRPDEIYERPASLDVATFIGSMNLLPAKPTGGRTTSGDVIYATEWGEIGVTCPHPPAGDVVLGIRPEKLRLVVDATAGNAFSGTIGNVMYYGDRVEVFLARDGLTLRALLPPEKRPKPLETAVFSVDAGDIRVFSAASGAAE